MRCDYRKVMKFAAKQLDPDAELDMLLHLEQCSHCFGRVYELKKIRDHRHFVYKPPERAREEEYEEQEEMEEVSESS
ncbi:MAG: hypothetical protein HY652_09780 [Acidobacteria bacterium]|nr:hypothetical protein [Acidobacteriota bacterium]